MTQLQLFTQVPAYYAALQAALSAARRRIHLAAYAFDDGQVARRIGHILAQKAASGVDVHLLVDEAGLYLDNWRNGRSNQKLLAQLQKSGVQVNLFRPNGRRLSQFNRLHCKFCAIDDQVAFVGGSNVGDHYLQWRDTNLRLRGDLGDGFRQLYASLRAFGGNGRFPTCPPALTVAGLPLLLTVPGHRQDIRRALLNLILSARTAVSLRSWYFLPDNEIMNALLSRRTIARTTRLNDGAGAEAAGAGEGRGGDGNRSWSQHAVAATGRGRSMRWRQSGGSKRPPWRR